MMRPFFLLFGLAMFAACAAPPPRTAEEAGLRLLSLNIEGQSLRLVAAKIAELADRPIRVAPGVNPEVNLILRDAPWREALRVVARSTDCRIEERDGFIELTRPETITLQGTEARVRTMLEMLAAYSGKTITIEPDVNGRALPRYLDLPWDEVLAAVAAEVGAAVVKAGPDHLHVLSKERLRRGLVIRSVPLRHIATEAHALRFLSGNRARRPWGDARGALPLLEELRAAAPEAYIAYDPASNRLLLRAEAERAFALLSIIDEGDRLPEGQEPIVETPDGRAVFFQRGRWYIRAGEGFGERS